MHAALGYNAYNMANTFNDTVVLITGGSSGIGKELARQLGEYGARVIITGRNKKNGLDAAKELKALGHDIIFKQIDMIDISATNELIKFVVKTYGKIDYVFNNAGIFMGGEFRDTPIERWHEVTNNNIFAVMNGTHFAYQTMLTQGYGTIVNVASAAGLFPVPAMGIYGSTKFALVGMSLALRNEAKALGIQVNVVCPTVVDTPLYDTASYNKVNKNKLLKFRNRLQKPDEAARKIIKGVVKNRATIHTSFSTQIAWVLYRIAPRLYDVLSRRIITMYRRNARKA